MLCFDKQDKTLVTGKIEVHEQSSYFHNTSRGILSSGCRKMLFGTIAFLTLFGKVSSGMKLIVDKSFWDGGQLLVFLAGCPDLSATSDVCDEQYACSEGYLCLNGSCCPSKISFLCQYNSTIKRNKLIEQMLRCELWCINEIISGTWYHEFPKFPKSEMNFQTKFITTYNFISGVHMNWVRQWERLSNFFGCSLLHKTQQLTTLVGGELGSSASTLRLERPLLGRAVRRDGRPVLVRHRVRSRDSRHAPQPGAAAPHLLHGRTDAWRP